MKEINSFPKRKKLFSLDHSDLFVCDDEGGLMFADRFFVFYSSILRNREREESYKLM